MPAEMQAACYDALCLVCLVSRAALPSLEPTDSLPLNIQADMDHWDAMMTNVEQLACMASVGGVNLW